MKQKYRYSKDIKAPASFGNYDITDLIRTGKIQKAATFFQSMTSRYKSKIAEVRMGTYPSYDREMVTYYEFTPSKQKSCTRQSYIFMGEGLCSLFRL